MTITRSLLVVGILLSQFPNSSYAGGRGGGFAPPRPGYTFPTTSSNPSRGGPATLPAHPGTPVVPYNPYPNSSQPNDGGNFGSKAVYAPNGGVSPQGGYAVASRRFAYACTIRRGEPDAGGSCTVYTNVTKRYGDNCKCGGQGGFID